MKKTLLTTLALGTLLAVTAQTQRLEIYEEFTGENCGPCAGTNPGLTTLIANNQSPTRKIILLRYQVAIPSAPGAGSLYQDNTTDPNARQTYYSVPFAPYARLDGTELPDLSGGGNDGHAGLLTQTIINNNYLVNAPVSIAASHSYTPNYDSLNVSVTVTAAQAFTPSGTLKLHVAMIEKEIHFTSPPGSNGEMDFEWIMRKMFPSASGTTMTAGAWANAQSQTITMKIKIPTYIKDKNEMALIVFVQDDGDKTIKNAGFSDAIALNVADAAMESSSVPTSCSNTVTPTLVIKNTGSPTLTSANINYTIDGGAVQTYSYTGSLASLATATVTLPAQTVAAAGTHTLVATITSPNGTTDINTFPDSKTTTFINFGTITAAPITQPFTLTTFPPTNWSLVDVGGDAIKWTRKTGISGSSSGTAAAKADFWNGAAGQEDDLILPYTAFGSGTQMTFYVASAPYTAASPEPDQLDLFVSTDCGATWATAYSKSGSTLNSSPAVTSAAFTPTSSTVWRQETVSLSAFDNMSGLLVKFRATSGYGNNLYVDDVNLTTTVGVNEVTEIAGLFVYPNPAANTANIKIALAKSSDVSVNIYNTIGELVYSESRTDLPAGDNVIQMNTSSFANGIYSVVINSANGSTSKKLIINK
jgi:hypothetical protein